VIYNKIKRIKKVNQVVVGVNYSIAKTKFLFLMIVQCQANPKHIKYNNHHHHLGGIIPDPLETKTMILQQMNKISLFKVVKVMMSLSRFLK